MTRADHAAAEIEIDLPLPSAPELSAERPTLRTLAGYEILGRLAVGGMAEVFLARERGGAGSARHVALKVIRPQLAADPGFVELFLQEGHVALGLRHPNLCHAYRFGVEAGHPFLAMELVAGVTLRDLVARARRSRRNLPPAVVAKIVSCVAEALHSAHVATDERGRPLGVVHQDVSPHNVMIGWDGTVKLLDFGVASTSRERERETVEQSTIRGKPVYLSPEQCAGVPVDARSDVFSLGVVMHEALTGKRLFARATTLDTLRAISCESLPGWSPAIPSGLAAVLDRALARDRAQRYASAAEMQEDLERWLAESRAAITAARIAEATSDVLGDEHGRPPAVDTSPDVVAWIGESAEPTPHVEVTARPESPPVLQPRRGRAVALPLAAGAALALAAASLAGWLALAGRGEPATQAPAASIAPAAAPPPLAEPVVTTTTAAPDDEAPAGEHAVARAEEARDVRGRAHERPRAAPARRVETAAAPAEPRAAGERAEDAPPREIARAAPTSAEFVDDPGF